MKQTRPRLLRWWMVALCLVTSWLCWWGVDKWLGPRPLWSHVLHDRHYYYPLSRDAGNEKVLAAELQVNQEGTQQTAKALVMLDSRTGKLLHRLAATDPEVPNVTYPPWIINDAVWRISSHSEKDSITHQLLRWRFQEEDQEQVIQTWKGHPSCWIALISVPGNPYFLVRHQFPLQVLTLYPFSNPFKAYFIGILFDKGMLAMPVFYESWQLPNQAKQPPQLLARWTTPPAYWNQVATLSPDEPWAVICEPWGLDRMAAQRARASGKKSFQGKELFDLYRAESKGIRFYDIRTGKLQHHFQDDDAVHFQAHVIPGGMMVTDSFHVLLDKSLSLSQIEKGEEPGTRKRHSESFTQRQHAFHFDGNGLHEMKYPSGLPPGILELQINGPVICGVQRLEKHSIHYDLAYEDQQLTVAHTVEMNDATRSSWVMWLGKTGQCITQQPSIDSSWYWKWKGQWPWLDSLMDKIRPWLRLDPDLVVLDQTKDRRLQHVFHHRIYYNRYFEFRYLFMLDFDRNERELFSVTLHAYEIPLKFYSPWWARMAACLPLVLLVLYILRRKRA